MSIDDRRADLTDVLRERKTGAASVIGVFVRSEKPGLAPRLFFSERRE